MGRSRRSSPETPHSPQRHRSSGAFPALLAGNAPLPFKDALSGAFPAPVSTSSRPPPTSNPRLRKPTRRLVARPDQNQPLVAPVRAL
jgi:hypothetical protein